MNKALKLLVGAVFAVGIARGQPAMAEDEAEKGAWEDVIPESTIKVAGIHMALMKNGKVLFLAKRGTYPEEGPVVLGYMVFDPADNTVDEPVEAQQAPETFFCSGHSQLADGKILFAGGGIGGSLHREAATFNPAEFDLGNDPWTDVGPMPEEGGLRFYPTATTMGNGKVLVSSGRHDHTDDDDEDQDVPTIFTVGGDPAWTMMSDPDARKVLHSYPFMFQLSDGKLFMGGGFFFDPDGTPSIHLDTYTLDVAGDAWDATAVSRAEKPGAAAVMYRPGKIMKAGINDGAVGDIVQTINMGGISPDWGDVASLNEGRIQFYLVTLPDGRVLAVGGTNGASPTPSLIKAGEWYNPDDATPTWDVLAEMTNGRREHSAAVLLPDARVLMGGGDVSGKTAEIFQPPYLFKSDDSEVGTDRPSITSAPSSVQYNTNFTVGTPDANDITKVSLIRLGTSTHGFDQDTRFIPLSFTKNGLSNTLSVAAPASGNHAPPGYYMLFILMDGDRTGIEYPSVAEIIQLTAVSP